MTPGPGDNGADKSIGEIVSEVSEKASLLVREEIELAKAEVTEKFKTLGKGAGVAIAAGTFFFFAFVVFLEALSWFWNDLFDVTNAIWFGFALTMVILIVLGVISGLLAKRWLSSGPPTPDMAIEQAKITRETLERQAREFDQIAPAAVSEKTEEDS
jgi:uncharacterized membrane protein YqjE